MLVASFLGGYTNVSSLADTQPETRFMSKPERRSRGTAPSRPVLRWPPHRWVIVVVAASLIWRLVRYGLCFPMWGDEAFIAVNFITRSFGELGGALDHPQIVPVGFLWLQWLVSRMLGTGEMALRLLPVLAGMVAVLVFWRLAPKMIHRRQAMAAVIIFAASYYPVRHSVEVKSYSLDLLIALAMIWQAWAICQSPKSVVRWIVFFLCGTAAVWFSYPIVFIIGGSMFVMGYCLYHHRVKASWYALWVAGGAVMAVSFFLMWKLVAVGQEVHHEGIHELKGWASAFPPMDSLTGFIGWFFRAHTGNMLAYPVGGNHGGSTATFVLIIFGMIALWRTRQRLVLALLLSPIPLMFIAAALKKYPYGDSARVEQHIAPAACLIAGAGLVAFLNHGWKKRGVVSGMQIACVVMLCFIGYGMVKDILEPYKKESDEVARQLVQDWTARAESGDKWVVFGSLGGSEYVPDLLPLGGSLARWRYDMLQYGPKDVSMMWGPAPDRVPEPGVDSATWLFVYYDDAPENNPFPKELADSYLEQVKSRLGEPVIEEYSLKEGDERVWLYRFDRVGGTTE